jgi:hypothetical protein
MAAELRRRRCRCGEDAVDSPAIALRSGMRGPGLHPCIVGALALALAGCGESEAPPPPGAPGLVVLHWWDAKGGPPAYLEAHDLKQQGSTFDHIEFTQVLMRLPSEGRVAYVTAPHATYNKGQAAAVVLDAGTDGAGNPRVMDGPVRFLGSTDGVPFIGRADVAVFDHDTQGLRLDNVEIVYEGLRQYTTSATLNRKQLDTKKLNPLPSVPALTAAMAALPRPLDLPPISRTTAAAPP